MDGRKTHFRWLVLLSVIPAMILPFLASLFYFVIIEQTWLAQGIYTLSKMFTLCYPLLVFVWIEHNAIDFRADSLKFQWNGIYIGSVVGLVMGGSILFLYFLTPLGQIVHQFKDQIFSKVNQFGVIDHYLAFSIFLAVLHSGIEEYYWRWFVFGRLRNVGNLSLAIFLAGYAFAAHHFVVLKMYFSWPLTIVLGNGVAVGGMFWCWLYHQQKSLMACCVSHLWVDVAILYIGYRILL